MYLLTMYQNNDRTDLAIFETLEDGRAFVSKIPGYSCREEDNFTYEEIDVKALPDYMEINFKGHIYPLSRFMFPGEERIEIFWPELANLSKTGSGMVDGACRVDAYYVNNDEMEEYILRRENKYRQLQEELANRSFETSRAFQGSEDGEAVMYRKKNEENWHFLTHMDPAFCDDDNIVDELIEEIENNYEL